MNVVFLATAWGPRFGGINAFNQELATALAEVLGSEGMVFCAVIRPSAEDIASAASRNVTLIPLDKTQAESFDTAWIDEIARWLTEHHPDQQISWWVGHDVVSGAAALAAPKIAGGGAALIMHMSYIAYQAIKHDSGVDAEAKHRQQKALFGDPQATLFAVGPLLRDACSDLAGREPVMLIPGFPELPASAPSRSKFVAITFGRMDGSSDRIKQGQLAVAGFGEAIAEWHLRPYFRALRCFDDRLLYVIGRAADSRVEEEQAIRTAEKRAGRLVNVISLPYDENRETLFDRLSTANVALMLSWHEGFGLVGWEAIAAEVPLILGHNSGLFRLIDQGLGGAGNGCVRDICVCGQRGRDDVDNYKEKDVMEVMNAILEVALDLPKAHQKAKTLRKMLCENFICTWANTARQFLSGLGHEQ